MTNEQRSAGARGPSRVDEVADPPFPIQDLFDSAMPAAVDDWVELAEPEEEYPFRGDEPALA
jgi:hypothetical protein